MELEEKTGRSVVTGENFLPSKTVKVIEMKDDVGLAGKGRKKSRK